MNEDNQTMQKPCKDKPERKKPFFRGPNLEQSRTQHFGTVGEGRDRRRQGYVPLTSNLPHLIGIRE